jgi:hypothetical protein
MATSHPLVSRFAEARLELRIARAPIVSHGAGLEEIVQLDIAREARGRARIERFRVWPGHAQNRIEAVGLDRGLAQLVLMVHEPRRRFELEIPRGSRLAPGMRVIRDGRERRLVESFTSDRKRHFLCGMDEQHLFIAELPAGVSTVRAAHEILKDPRVTAAERAAPARTIRQGEWFFVALAPAEQRDVEAQVGRGHFTRKKTGIAEAAGIRRVGRPHVADEVFVVRSTDAPRAYVRGAVRHPDHRAVIFQQWRLVVPNREALERPVEGVAWVD